MLLPKQDSFLIIIVWTEKERSPVFTGDMIVERQAMDKKRFSRIALIMAISLFLSGCAGNIPFTDTEEKGSNET